MALFKCKMCGGTLEITNETVAVCEYCGTNQTLPKLDDDRRANLYDRANHFRRNNEFDKAMGIYERILNEDNTDAEAYWSLVLCRYGIEYVEDPASHKRIPTVNRAQFTSIFDDDNYKSALQYADGYQRSIYEEEAKAINEIQKGILAISQKEEPFDVFICYKETDNNGRRTPDSVLANDLYHQLTQEGFKVFFARITLEDKLGSAYEPYIFAALNSAKVMVVLGTKPEHFNAVWVKNEWSRYLALIKNGAKKMLIPAYRDMDPYDLPEEFSHLQAQDMGKLGFMQDLIRGIKKIAQTDEPKPTVVKETIVSAGNANIAPLLKRAFMFLEDCEWNSADEYCEKVLDMDPECAEAYLGKLMAELRVSKQEELQKLAEPFDEKNNYQKVIRFADEALRAELIGCIEHINTRNENNRLEAIYSNAKAKMSSAVTENTFKEAANSFDSIRHYRDAAELAEKCREKAETARKDTILSDAKMAAYSQSISRIETALEKLQSIAGWRDADKTAERFKLQLETLFVKKKDETLYDGKSKMVKCTRLGYEEAIRLFKKIPGWKDADKQIEICKEKIEELNAKEETERLAREAEQQRVAEEKRYAAEVQTAYEKEFPIVKERYATERRLQEIRNSIQEITKELEPSKHRALLWSSFFAGVLGLLVGINFEAGFLIGMGVVELLVAIIPTVVILCNRIKRSKERRALQKEQKVFEKKLDAIKNSMSLREFTRIYTLRQTEEGLAQLAEEERQRKLKEQRDAELARAIHKKRTTKKIVSTIVSTVVILLIIAALLVGERYLIINT